MAWNAELSMQVFMEISHVVRVQDSSVWWVSCTFYWQHIETIIFLHGTNVHFPLLQLEAKPSDAATAQKAARRCSREISRDVNIFIDIIPGTIWKASCPLFGGFERVLSKQDNGHFGFQEHEQLYRNHPKLKVTRTKLSHCHDSWSFQICHGGCRSI